MLPCDDFQGHFRVKPVKMTGKSSFKARVGSFFRGAVSSMEKSGFFRPRRNMFLPFLPMFWKKPISSSFL